MLDPGPLLGDDPVDVFVDGMKRATLRRHAHDAPELAGAGERALPRRADIALVCPDRRFITVQQFVPDLAVVCVA
jgi:hypothetical protein